MKIKQVEELVGITSKNIRFYEDQGLLSPDRADNGYREYHDADVKVLKKIKLLRKFGVPVEEIKKVFDGKELLNECLAKHLLTLKKEHDNLIRMENLAEQILVKNETIENIDTDQWLESVDHLETEGTVFVDLSKEDIHMRKKAGAFFGGVISIAFMLAYIALMLWAFVTEGMPTGVLIVMIVIPAIIVLCVIFALISRIKEINGGEEDEASKY